MRAFCLRLLGLLAFCLPVLSPHAAASSTAPRPRIIVSTDIGGSDFDDFQSLVHLLVYADEFEIEGLISSPGGGTGRVDHILKVLDAYAHDYPNLKTYSGRYPAPDALRAVTKQGSLAAVGLHGFGQPTAGSQWIIACAKRPDPRPLWVLVWGGIDDLAQALHDDPSIESKLRVHFIGGPNKKWSAPAYNYVAREHPQLWMIEDNSTYYGWFNGGNQTGDWGNRAFVAAHIAGEGALGDFFAGLSLGGVPRPTLKMGDTPTIAYLLGHTPDDPSSPSWGGSFVRAWDRPRYVFDQAQTTPPTAANQVETCSILEIIYHPATVAPAGATAALVLDKQEFPGFADPAGAWHFIFSPNLAKTWSYTIKSTVPALNGQAGGFTAVAPPPTAAAHPSPHYPNWWTDNPDPALAEGVHQGAKTVNRWREEYLGGFAAHMARCKAPAAKPASTE